MPKSSSWRQADAVGGHPTQTNICAVYPRSHRVPARIYARAIKAIREEDANETSRRTVLHLVAGANVRGMSSDERAHALISLADPAFRDELNDAAREMHLI